VGDGSKKSINGKKACKSRLFFKNKDDNENASTAFFITKRLERKPALP